jgi:adenine-specific DNA-methyltransferase
VFDPFAGVGSTSIASIKNNRNAVGIDKEEIYCKVAKERIKKFKEGSLKPRTMDKPIHIPSPKDRVAKMPDGWYEGKLG